MIADSTSQKRDKSPNRSHHLQAHHNHHHPHNRRDPPPPPPEAGNGNNNNDDFIGDGRRQETLYGILDSGIEILEKLDNLEKVMPSLMTEMVQDILTDYMFMDGSMKKELKKCQDAAAIALHGGSISKNKHHHHHHHSNH
jgi:hypothetical protein